MAAEEYKCNCEDCRGACTNKPGWFRPEEIEPLAQHLGLSIKETFEKHLSVDWWNAAEGLGDTFLLSPAIPGYEGSQFPADPHGRCVFFTREETCSIYPVRPFECRTYFHNQANGAVHDRHRDIAKSWAGEQKQIVELLGEKPYAYVFSFFDMLLRI